MERLLVIAYHYRAFIKDQVNALSQYFDEITVLLPYNPLTEISKYIPLSYFRHVENFTKSRLIDPRDKPSNVDVRIVPVMYIIPDSKNKKLGDTLTRKFKEYMQKYDIQFDIIHAHFTWPLGYAGVKLAKEFDVPAVVTIHENREWFLREYNSGNKKIYWTWQNADALIRVNKIDVPLLKKFNKNVFSIPNGFNPKRIYVTDKELAREYLKLPKDKKIIFSLGVLTPRKGFQYLIQAMPKILEKHKEDVLCYIGGSGPYLKSLQKLIKKLNIKKHVHLLGYIPDDQLALWMNAADLFVLPSLSEGNPTVMFEALGVGLPFVGTAVGGVPEIITSEDYGLLCPPADPECLAEKILIALEKEWNREKIRKYAEQFTWENITHDIYKIYTRLSTKN